MDIARPHKNYGQHVGEQLEKEARLATELLAGKTVRVVWRHRVGEVGIEFTDGSRLFVNRQGQDLELSITGASEIE